MDNGGSYACVATRGMWEISVPSIQFFCEPKIVLENTYLDRC